MCLLAGRRLVETKRLKWYIQIIITYTCEDPLSSATPYAEELENDIDLLTHDQDLRQYRFSGGDQNRAEDGDEEEVYSRDEEGQHVFQSLSPD